MKEIEVVIDTEEIADYVINELIKRGYAPGEKEIEDLADIFFDYLVHKKIIEEEQK